MIMMTTIMPITMWCVDDEDDDDDEVVVPKTGKRVFFNLISVLLTLLLSLLSTHKTKSENMNE